MSMTNDQLIHLFANRADKAKGRRHGNLSVTQDGLALLSYSCEIGRFVLDKKGKPIVLLLNQRSYSSTTTGHQSSLRKAYNPQICPKLGLGETEIDSASQRFNLPEPNEIQRWKELICRVAIRLEGEAIRRGAPPENPGLEDWRTENYLPALQVWLNDSGNGQKEIEILRAIDRTLGLKMASYISAHNSLLSIGRKRAQEAYDTANAKLQETRAAAAVKLWSDQMDVIGAARELGWTPIAENPVRGLPAQKDLIARLGEGNAYGIVSLALDVRQAFCRVFAKVGAAIGCADFEPYKNVHADSTPFTRNFYARRQYGYGKQAQGLTEARARELFFSGDETAFQAEFFPDSVEKSEAQLGHEFLAALAGEIGRPIEGMEEYMQGWGFDRFNVRTFWDGKGQGFTPTEMANDPFVDLSQILSTDSKPETLENACQRLLNGQGEGFRIVGEQIETTKSARFPRLHANRLWRFLVKAKNGTGYQHNRHSEHAGDFRIDSCAVMTGAIRAGCHYVTWEAVEFLAEKLGLPSEAQIMADCESVTI